MERFLEYKSRLMNWILVLEAPLHLDLSPAQYSDL